MVLNFLKNQKFNPNMKKSAIDVYNSLPEQLQFRQLNLSKENSQYDFESLCSVFESLSKVEDKEELEVKFQKNTKTKSKRKEVEIESQVEKCSSPALRAQTKNYILNNTFDKFLKLLNKKRIEPDGIIDLHGFNLKEAKLKLKNYVFQAFNSNKRNILIITGKGLNKTGLLKKEVPIWLNEKDINKIYGVGEFGVDSFDVFCRGDLDCGPADKTLQAFVSWQKRHREK